MHYSLPPDCSHQSPDTLSSHSRWECFRVKFSSDLQEASRSRGPTPCRHPQTSVMTRPWMAVGNARKVAKRLELVLPGEWTLDEARMLSEGARIRVI